MARLSIEYGLMENFILNNIWMLELGIGFSAIYACFVLQIVLEILFPLDGNHSLIITSIFVLQATS